MEREEGSGWGTRVYLWWIHVDIWQNQYNIVNLKNKINKRRNYLWNLRWKTVCIQFTLHNLLIKGFLYHTMHYFDQKNTQKMNLSPQTHLSTNRLLETLALLHSGAGVINDVEEYHCWKEFRIRTIFIFCQVWTPRVPHICQVEWTAKCVQINPRMDCSCNAENKCP